MISRSLNSEIISFATKIATTHSAIQHLSAADVFRFVGFNPEQLDADNRSKLNWDELVLSLSLPNNSQPIWNYDGSGSSNRKLKKILIAVLGVFGDETNFEDEEAVCEAAENVLDDIETWLKKNYGAYDWPLIDLMTLDNITARRIYNVGVAGCSGAAMEIMLNSNLHWLNTNPLNAMSP